MAQKALSTKALYHNLNRLYEASPEVPLNKYHKWVIFSDLHMGDGGSNDDFRRNSDLFTSALKEYYLQDHALILNGDVEELQRFSLKNIYQRWEHIYELFDEFQQSKRLYKTIGNHDSELLHSRELPFSFDHLEGLRLVFNDQRVFIFHGHQASKKYQRHNELIGFTLKYVANPLGIKSYSVSHSSRKQYKIEKRVYGYSSFNKVMSIIGHTHRPLFESLHKVERVKFKIEQLCREHAEARNGNADEIAKSIKYYKKELKRYYRENPEQPYKNDVYNSMFHIPCLFNSGCVVGKRGITCLEIEGDRIRLVHWFDKNISEKYLIRGGYKPMNLEGTDFYRTVINDESLDYIFTRINFLA